MDDAPRRPMRAYKELSLQQLRSFCEVYRFGSYAAAARELHLTTPAVWEQLKGLERHFEVELFERHGSGVRPTPDGERLIELVRPLLAGLESTKDMLHQRAGVLPRTLTVVSNLRVVADEISRSMFQFQSRYPDVRLVIRFTSGEEVEPIVREGETDIALTLEPDVDEPVSSAVVYEPAGALDYLLLTTPHHPLTSGKTLRLESIVEHPLVLGTLDAYSRHRVQEVFHRHNLIHAMRVAVETSSDEYTLACVRAGLGVGIAVGKVGSPTHRGLGFRSLRHWFGTARVGFLWRQGAHVPPIQRELAEMFRSALAERGDRSAAQTRSRPPSRQANGT